MAPHTSLPARRDREKPRSARQRTGLVPDARSYQGRGILTCYEELWCRIFCAARSPAKRKDKQLQPRDIHGRARAEPQGRATAATAFLQVGETMSMAWKPRSICPTAFNKRSSDRILPRQECEQTRWVTPQRLCWQNTKVTVAGPRRPLLTGGSPKAPNAPTSVSARAKNGKVQRLLSVRNR